MVPLPSAETIIDRLEPKASRSASDVSYADSDPDLFPFEDDVDERSRTQKIEREVAEGIEYLESKFVQRVKELYMRAASYLRREK
jgi:hypothetical protein